jgi:hypothetical protein
MMTVPLSPPRVEIIDTATVNGYVNAMYQLTTITPLVENPTRNVYELSQAELISFLDDYLNFAEFIVKLERITI